jgi:AcrR family transcriptional regulator
MPRQRPETRQRVRNNIEMAALVTLADKGYEATGMRDIAKEAGMSPASLYNHYESKEALFKSLVGTYRGRVLDETQENPLRDYMAKCQFPFDIPKMAKALEAVVIRDREYLVLWYIDLVHFGGGNFRNELAPTLLLETPPLKARLKEVREAGLCRQDPEVLFKIVYTHLFNFFLVLHVFDKGKFFGGQRAKKRTLEEIYDVFTHGMLTPKGEKEAAKNPAGS